MPNTPQDNPSKKIIKITKESIKNKHKTPPNHPNSQASKQLTTQHYMQETSMIKHGENKIQSQESYLQQRVMVKMEV